MLVIALVQREEVDAGRQLDRDGLADAGAGWVADHEAS